MFTTPDMYMIADGNAFFMMDGHMFAAPILIDGTIEWDEYGDVTADSESDAALLDKIRKALSR